MVNWKHLNHGGGFWIGRKGGLRIRVKLNSLFSKFCPLKKSKSVGSLLFRVSELSNLYIPRTCSFQCNSSSGAIFYGETFTARQTWGSSSKIEGRLKKKKGKNILFDPSIPPCLLQMSGLFYLLVNYRRGERSPVAQRTRRIPWPNLIIPDRG